VTALAITRIRLALMGHLPVKLAIGLRNLGPDRKLSNRLLRE
jgi:hypothetical protein